MPIINLKDEHQLLKKRFLQSIEYKCNTFLKENNLNEVVLILTVECEHCKELCYCKEAPLFECPVCHYIWEVREVGLGFKEDVMKDE